MGQLLLTRIAGLITKLRHPCLFMKICEMFFLYLCNYIIGKKSRILNIRLALYFLKN